MAELNPGDTASYVSGAQGTITKKTGKVLCIIPKSKSARDAVAKALGVAPSLIPPSRLKGQDSSLYDRYAIAVPRGVHGIDDYYMPLVKNVDRQMGLGR